jgi:aerobic-type carbon monoxide dehydrogenase small subunit (CoxS/CutS family)
LLSTVPHDETRLSALREAAALADGYEVLTIAGIAFTAEEVQLIEREMVPA